MNTPGTMAGMTGGAVGAPLGPQVATQEQLNTYIYDHLCRQKLYDLARQFVQVCPIKVDKTKKEMNGDDGMDMDSKDDIKRPDDLPIASIPPHYSETSFLYDWWCQFWDMYGTIRTRGNNPMAQQYLAHNMAQAKSRNMMQQNLMGAGANMMQRPQQFTGMQANGMNNMAKQAIANRNGMMTASKMPQNNMQDGDRPQSPGSIVNAPSPSKRPRLDDGNFNGQPGQAGRGQPVPGSQMGNMPGGPNGMIMQNGMPADMNQINFAQNGQPKIEMSAGGPQGMEGSFDMMNQQRPMANGGGNPSQGNHALQDYQMQLMLLEQQNKKRLLMARQEQDNINHVPGSSQPSQIQFAGATPGMSPQTSRPGPSPNPNDQMKRMPTPKMGPGNMPGSPAIPGDNRGSPMPGGFDQNNVPPNMRHQLFAAQQNMIAQGQPPNSHQNFQSMQMQNMPQNMDQMRMAAQQNRLPNGQQWPPGGQPMMQTPSQQGQAGAQQQRSNMPPPPAPNPEQQRTQPSSPAPAVGPPTPSQPNKAPPKGKKETGKKNAPQKGAAKKDAVIPAASDAAPPTPTPQTPITPMNAGSFNKTSANANGGPTAPPQATPAAAAMDPVTTDLSAFGTDFTLDFTDTGSDVLENFDFDSFLHNTDDSNSFVGGYNDFMLGNLDAETAGP